LYSHRYLRGSAHINERVDFPEVERPVARNVTHSGNVEAACTAPTGKKTLMPSQLLSSIGTGGVRTSGKEAKTSLGRGGLRAETENFESRVCRGGK
jgi:hypothetical protein